MTRHAASLAALLLATQAIPAAAAPAPIPLCQVLARAVDSAATAPTGPVFVPSYPTATLPALHGTAFVYDNALAVIALIACADTPRAARIGAALILAAQHDRFFHDGRIRNAYRAGPLDPAAPAPALPGWWDTAARRWDEDPYQTGTATGNVAWAALALIALDRAHPDPAAHAAARSLMAWVAATVPTTQPIAGYAGGFFGEEPTPTRLLWASTEHNVDAAAAFHLLGMMPEAARARGFVAAMWDPPSGRFWLGTNATATAINRAGSGIDAQLWPLIGITDAPPDWQRAASWVRTHHAVPGGYGFRDGAAGLWTEGTAQAALILHQPQLLATLLAQQAPDGLLYATPDSSVPTGLALTPQSTTDDFRYFHLPHLGATAWAVLAQTRTNPFQPQQPHGPPPP